MWNTILSPDFFNAVLRATTPILFATLAAGVAQQSGICNMALEGIMVFCALFGVIFSSLTQSWVLGILLTMITGGVIGLIMAFFVLQLKTDEILAAIAINLIASGSTVLILLAFSGDRGSSASVASVSAPVVLGQNVLTWLALALVAVMHLFLYHTPLGLRIRAVGENQNAAESVGISSVKIRYIALVISGMLCSLGGYFMSGGYMNMFTKEMAAGRGFIALAAGAMGRNTPVGGFLVALLFGISQAFSNAMQLTNIPMELVQMIPYAATLIGLAVFSHYELHKRARLSEK